MQIPSDNLFRILGHLEAALEELQGLDPQDRTLKKVIAVVLTVVSILRFYIATQGEGRLP